MDFLAETLREEELPRSSLCAETRAQVWGPFYAMSAPFRTQLAPIGAKGKPLIMKGSVYRILEDQKSSIAVPFCVIDLWQAGGLPNEGYDYFEEGPEKRKYVEAKNLVGKAHEYRFRARMVCDEKGSYEYHTVVPSPYFDESDGKWRCPHIHYYLRHPKIEEKVTQMYFAGESLNGQDNHCKPDLEIQLEEAEAVRGGEPFKYYTGKFDLFVKSKN